MDFNEYQKKAMASAVYPNIGSNIVYPTLGINGEAGEIAEKVKKIIRDKKGVWGVENQEAIQKELGDVLWYCAALCYEFGLSLDDVAKANIEKLTKRVLDNTIHGSGDDR